MNKAFVPNRIRFVENLKRAVIMNFPAIKRTLGYIAVDKAFENGSPIIIKDYHIPNHDLYHLEVSSLDRIQIGRNMVSGIHGINSEIFHDAPIVEEYPASFDEVRVAFHEWMTRTSLANTFKAFIWMNWLLLRGINPLAVLFRHYKTLKSPAWLAHIEAKD